MGLFRSGAREQTIGARPPISHPDAVPVTLLTGFLGSGKTTFLNDLLDDPRMAGSAVVINEFGSMSLDHDLVRAGREQYVLTSTGCLCCTATSDIRTSLFELHELAKRSGRPVSRVIVETTGLADPAPIVNSLIPGGAPANGFRDHAVARTFRLSGIIATLDAAYGQEALETHFECWKQLAFADHIVMTKMDLFEKGEPLEFVRTAWREWLREINPAAQVHDRNSADFDIADLVDLGSYNPTDKAEDVVGWLAMENLAGIEPNPHEHDVNRHDAGIQALPLVHDEPLDPRAVDTFLKMLTSRKTAGLLRLKGIFALADDPGRPYVVHAVQYKLYPGVRLDYWPSIDVRSRVMVIGWDLPIQTIRESFEALVPRAGRRRQRERVS